MICAQEREPGQCRAGQLAPAPKLLAAPLKIICKIIYHDPCSRERTRTVPGCTTRTCSNTACCTSEHYMQDYIMIRAQERGPGQCRAAQPAPAPTLLAAPLNILYARLYHDPCTRERTRTVPGWTTCTCSSTVCCTSEHYMQDYTMIRAQG
jgi:hypothetical protein